MATFNKWLTVGCNFTVFAIFRVSHISLHILCIQNIILKLWFVSSVKLFDFSSVVSLPIKKSNVEYSKLIELICSRSSLVDTTQSHCLSRSNGYMEPSHHQHGTISPISPLTQLSHTHPSRTPITRTGVLCCPSLRWQTHYWTNDCR